MATRAKAGGEIGRNGEFYKGGTYLPSTALPKRGTASRKAATRRALVKPGVWDTVPADKVAIYPCIQPFVYVDGEKVSAKYPDDHTAIKYYFDKTPFEHTPGNPHFMLDRRHRSQATAAAPLRAHGRRAGPA